ncbi:divalent-cation tolerance protein CutA [Luteimonas aquatica]|uniref:divalent-cation tolerance protein CutA n=1 Tax=Luteimonas aquatica TaxID=450364 RepID=UPI001F563041|nr:divalent-cation tolerance protein CutA [Luteimonas aquatica]
MSDVRIVFCTCPDAGTAERIAQALVGERLAACVNLLPGVESVYRWQGALERSREVQLIAKTVEPRLEALIARVRALHPYELPEILAIAASGGLPDYLDWVRAETGHPPGG